MTPIRVLVVDDQSLFREGLLTLLSTLPGIAVVGQASDGQMALTEVARLSPQVVLMDLRMPTLNGVEATRRLRAEHPETRVVVLTTFDDDVSVFDALGAGALGYLLKDASPAQLSEAIRLAAAGESFLTPRVATLLVQSVARARPRGGADNPLTALSPREREILALLSRGASNKEIANALDVAEGTVKNHVTSIFGKLGVSDRLQAALLAREYGLPG